MKTIWNILVLFALCRFCASNHWIADSEVDPGWGSRSRSILRSSRSDYFITHFISRWEFLSHRYSQNLWRDRHCNVHTGEDICYQDHNNDWDVGQLVAAYTFGRGFASMRTTAAIVVSTWILIALLIGVGHAANHADPSKSKYYISPTPVSLFDESN